jgi:hypothetical protein
MVSQDQAIQRLTQKKKELLEKREKFMRPILELDKEIAALTLAVAVLLRDETPADAGGFPLHKIRNMTQTQALLEIANYNGGFIKSLEVKSILIAAKLMKNTRNAAGMVNGIITRSEAFERVKRGEYRLKQSSPLAPRHLMVEVGQTSLSVGKPI